MSKVALVTGASRGIGRAVALRLGRAGYDVAVHYHKSVEQAQGVVDELRQLDVRTEKYSCDVADSAAVNRMVLQIEKDLGDVAVLVNNAGISQQKLFTDLTDEDWKRMIDVHLGGSFYVTRAVLPSMIRRREGVIINVSSMWGQVGASCEVH